MKRRPWLSVRKPLRWEWVLTPLLCLVIRRQQSYTVSQTYIRRNRYIISNIQIKIHVFICKYRTETSSVCSFMLMICSLQTTGRPSWIRNSFQPRVLMLVGISSRIKYANKPIYIRKYVKNVQLTSDLVLLILINILNNYLTNLH